MAAIDEVLRRAAQLTARSQEMLAEPRPEPAPQWQPAQPNRYRGFELETFSDMLKASEARINKRIDALEALFQSLWHGVDGLADEAGKATGELEKRLRDEMRKEVESFRGELALLRAQAKAVSPQGRKAISRAPWKDIDALTAN